MNVQTATGGSGSAQTPTPIDYEMPASGATVTIKNGTTALALGTGTTTPITNISFNERGFYEWTAIDPAERYDSGATLAAMELVVKSSAASRQYMCEIEWDE